MADIVVNPQTLDIVVQANAPAVVTASSQNQNIVVPTLSPINVTPVALLEEIITLSSSQGPPGPPGAGGGSVGAITEITTSDQLESNQRYLVSGDSLQLLNLPLTAQVDDFLWLYGTGTGLFRVTQNDAQTIRFNGSRSTPGLTGKIESTHTNSILKLLYVGAGSWLVDETVGNFEVL